MIDRNNLVFIESINDESYKMGKVTTYLVRDVSAPSVTLVYEEYDYTDGRHGWSINDGAGRLLQESSIGFEKQWWKDNL